MTLSFAGVLDRMAFTHAADRVLALVSRPEVAAGWDEESSCAGMSVGGLARHLVDQSGYVVEFLGIDPEAHGTRPSIGLLEHYAWSPWAHEDLTGPDNLDIRDTWNALAGEGHAAAVALQETSLGALPDVLAAAPTWMYLPWQDVRMAVDDFVVTRMMEIVVHSDDLADSVGLPTPSFGPAVAEPVVALLGALAAERHGEGAVVRTLVRPQRAPATVTAF